MRRSALSLLLVGVLAGGCANDTSTPAPSTQPITSAPASETALPYRAGPTVTAGAVSERRLTPTATITVRQPEHGRLYVDAGYLWVHAGSALQRIDPTTNRVTRTIRIEGGGQLAFGLGSVWVPNFDAGTAARYDLATGRRIATLKVGADPDALAVVDGALWVANHRDGAVSRVNVETGVIETKVTVGITGRGGPGAFAQAAGLLWVVAPNTAAVTGIDTKTNRVARQVTLADPLEPYTVAVADELLWVPASDVNGGPNAVVSIDAATGVERGTVVLPRGFPTTVVGVGPRAWVTLISDPPAATPGSVVGIDTATVRAVDAVRVPAEASSVISAFGSMWFALPAKNQVVRVPLSAFQ